MRLIVKNAWLNRYGVGPGPDVDINKPSPIQYSEIVSVIDQTSGGQFEVRVWGKR